MKTILRLSALLALVLRPIPVTCSSAPHVVQLKVSPFGTVSHATLPRQQPSKSQTLLISRGGSEASSDKDLIETASNGFLALFGAVSAFHGFVLACAPSLGRKLLGTGVEEGDTVAAYAEEGIGVFTIEYGLTAFLAARGKMSPEMAIGYGTIPDLLFLGKNLANGKFSEFGVQKLMTGLTIVSAGCTYGILADKLHMGPIIEILAISAGLQGGYKYLDPVGAGERMLGSDLSEKPVAKTLFRAAGQMKLVSAFFRAAIAFGVKPLRALSYTTFFNSVLVLDSIFIRKTPEEVGKKKALYHQLGVLALGLTMGTVWFVNSD